MKILVCFLALVASANSVMKCSELYIANLKKSESSPGKYFQPGCDENGDYKPVQCKDNWCTCVTKAGERVDPYIMPSDYTFDMNCACALSTFKSLSQKCLYNGNFPPACMEHTALQEIDELGAMCTYSGEYSGLQKNATGDGCFCSRPDRLVPISRMYQATGDSCDFMSCDCALDEMMKGEKLNCSVLGNYPTRCLEEMAFLQFVTCDDEGFYTPVQCDDYRCYCADPDEGKQLGAYQFNANSTDRKWANCKCAVHQQQYSAVGLEMNLCKTNGNYESCSMKLTRQISPQGAFVEPSCNCIGMHKPVQCDDKWCYCSNQYGRIHAEYWTSIENKSKMRCDCARQEDNFIRNSTTRRFLDCDRFGNFMPKL